MSDVLNLKTGVMSTYSCPPAEAVVAAFEQSKGNFNTWEYSEFQYYKEGMRSERCLFLGDFGVVFN